jgi:hypothetical protein
MQTGAVDNCCHTARCVDLILMYIFSRDEVTKKKQFANEGEFIMHKAA